MLENALSAVGADRERGSAVVDFVLVMVVLVPFVLGIAQVGLVLHVRNTLTAAASDGARAAARSGATPAEASRGQELIRGGLADRYADDVTATVTSIGGVPAYRGRRAGPSSGARGARAVHRAHRGGSRRAGGRPVTRRSERGTATVEFVWLTILLLAPFVYVLIAVFDAQRASYAVSAASRSAARAYLVAPDAASAEQRARVAARCCPR